MHDTCAAFIYMLPILAVWWLHLLTFLAELI
jgi:hypothetical protein